MTVRSKIIAALALAVALLGAGCGGESAPMSVETDEPYYRQGKQLEREGRDAEALSMFLKVIERRGEQASAESHLEAGVIFLNHAKNPIEAIHHFQKYLELQPNAKQASVVRGFIDVARREFARTLPGHPLESQVVGIDQSDQISALRREVDDLKAENATLRALSPAPSLRVTRTTTDVETPLIGPGTPPAANPPIVLRVAEPEAPAVITAPPKPAAIMHAPAARSAPSGGPAGRKHTVAAGDTLYNIARKYGVKMEDIVAANHDLLSSVASPLRKGAELKIP